MQQGTPDTTAPGRADNGCSQGFSTAWDKHAATSGQLPTTDAAPCPLRSSSPCRQKMSQPCCCQGRRDGRLCRTRRVRDKAPLPLGHDPRLERPVPTPGHRDLHRPCLGQQRLGPPAVAGMAAVAPGRIMLVIAEMIVQFAIKRGLHDQLGQLLQHQELHRKIYSNHEGGHAESASGFPATPHLAWQHSGWEDLWGTTGRTPRSDRGSL